MNYTLRWMLCCKVCGMAWPNMPRKVPIRQAGSEDLARNGVYLSEPFFCSGLRWSFGGRLESQIQQWKFSAGRGSRK
jgi:hypothetical protein